MKISEINPFVRYARKNEKGFTSAKMLSSDHRIFCVCEGEARLHLKNEEYTLGRGTVVYWRSGTAYTVIPCENAVIAGCNFDFTQENKDIYSPVPPVSADKVCHLIEKVMFSDFDGFNDFIILENAYMLVNKFIKLADEYEGRELYFEETCSALLKEILTACARLSVTANNSKPANLAQEVLLYIRTNYDRKLDNAVISEHFGYHPNYLNSLVLQRTGTSMHRYLLNYRMNKAIEILQTTTMPISKIAELVGMPDIKHFSKTFINIVGHPPSYYKNTEFK
ncbi:MAG: helix-turn-helix transcriptional regulator [Clostridia bacterium]|nr:helix-turn-helix transcriptional regulator [Clostridia bacterium]